eukprot:5540968-Prymnesium_polylepis.1
MAASARALRMPVPRAHDIPATPLVVVSVRALVSHSPATALSRTYVKRAVHASKCSPSCASASELEPASSPSSVARSICHVPCSHAT